MPLWTGFRNNEQADNSGYYHNPLESLRVGAVLILPFGQDESRDYDNRHFGYLRGLELYAHERHPARCPVDTFHHHDQYQQYCGSRQQEDREYLKPFVGDVVHEDHNHSAYHQDNAVLGDGPPMVAALIGKRTGSTEHLCNGDEAEEEENNPDYFVSFEYAFNKSIYNSLTYFLNWSPRSS